MPPAQPPAPGSSGDEFLGALRYRRGDTTVTRPDGAPFTLRDAEQVIGRAVWDIARLSLRRKYGGGLRDDVADDAAQHALAACFDGRCNAETVGAAVAFVQTAAKHKYLDLVGRSHEADEELDAEHHVDPAGTPADQAEHRDQINRVVALAERVLAQAGRKQLRIAAFLQHRLVGEAPAIDRSTEAGRREADRLYQARSKGAKYFLEVARGLPLNAEDLAMAERIAQASSAEEAADE